MSDNTKADALADRMLAAAMGWLRRNVEPKLVETATVEQVRQLGFDSLDLAELTMWVEEKCNLKIEDEWVEWINDAHGSMTLREAAQVVAKKAEAS